MSIPRQSLSSFDDRSLKKHHQILLGKNSDRKSNGKKELVIANMSRKKELALTELVERLIIDSAVSSNRFLEGTSNKSRRRTSTTSSNNSFRIDRLLQDEDNDWFFEKILEKFESIRSKKVNRYVRSSYQHENSFPRANDYDNDAVYGVERIIERRYYVKKPKLVSKRDQLTSTNDLTRSGKKNRQFSGVSSITAASTCSQCSSSTPTYVENLREQSDSLRYEIRELKNEIEQLQTSQKEFFQQLQTHFQPKTNFTTSQNSVPSNPSLRRSPLEKIQTFSHLPVPLSTGKKDRSISTESHRSSSTISSGKTTPIRKSVVRPNAVPLNTSVASTPAISEFMATKNPSIAPVPPYNAYVSSKSSSIALPPPIYTYNGSKLPPVNTSNGSKPLPMAPTSPVDARISSKSSSVASTPPITEFTGSKNPVMTSIPPVVVPIGPFGSRTSSVAPTPPITEFTGSKNPVIASVPPVVVPIGPLGSRTSSVAPTPPTAFTPVSSARIPVYENELAHRRILSPRSRIVASSASIQESSDSSSGSNSPELIPSNPQKNSKILLATLRDNDLKDLVQYSSQLELSGFPPSVTPVIPNPNTSSTFWESVDQYIENTRSTNINTGLPPIPRSNNGKRLGLYYTTTRQLDKYDLEIKPQGIIESSAPFLMPPSDILP